jgi:hypothetical protein
MGKYQSRFDKPEEHKRMKAIFMEVAESVLAEGETDEQQVARHDPSKTRRKVVDNSEGNSTGGEVVFLML